MCPNDAVGLSHSTTVGEVLIGFCAHLSVCPLMTWKRYQGRDEKESYGGGRCDKFHVGLVTWQPTRRSSIQAMRFRRPLEWRVRC